MSSNRVFVSPLDTYFRTVKLRATAVSSGLLICCIVSACQVFGQSSSSNDATKPQDAAAVSGAGDSAVSKRIFGIVPNYRTSATLHPYVPISPEEKFKLASQDAFDRGTVVLAAAFAGQAQLTKANPSFGLGAAAYGRYFGTSYADYVIGDFMTEGVYPTLLHQDPRYFRRGYGSGWSRLGYAVGQILFTHTDKGKNAFNYSEILGNSTAVAISNAYYADNRTAPEAAVKLSTQLGVDAAANVLKEFWPDLQRKLSRKN